MYCPPTSAPAVNRNSRARRTIWPGLLAMVFGASGAPCLAADVHVGYEVVAALGGASNGTLPRAALIQAADGSFYGTTSEGGASGGGTVFRIGAAGTVTTLHSFSGNDGFYPQAGLIQASDGSFYSTTVQGGASGFGTVFKISAAGLLTTLHSFTSGDGAYPQAGLIQASDGSFYGTTVQGGESGIGTVFKMDAAGALTTLHSFSRSDGAYPYSALIEASDGNFYGTTSQDGPSGYGTVFKIDRAGTLTTLHSFSGADGAFSYSSLIEARDGSFYGTTYGAAGSGTAFKMNAAGALTTVHWFSSSEGAGVYAGLIQAGDGSFYGATVQGSTHGYGMVFRMDTAGTVTTLHSFSYSDGASPYAGLIQASNGSFYGTAYRGGTSGVGTIFKMDAAGSLTTLYGFVPTGVGANPSAPVIQASDGSVYGTTLTGGGALSRGTVFKIDAAGRMTTVHTFAYTDGGYSYAGLTQASDGNFYGTTSDGGASGRGTVFKLDAAGPLTTLHSFTSNEGYSYAGLIQASDGSLYGTTAGSGAGYGTVFKIDAAGALTTLHRFLGTDGAYPYSPLTQASDGTFYGTTYQGGTFQHGTIFKMDAAGNVTTLHSFGFSDGMYVYAPVIQATDGSFYGTTFYGGAGYGTIFEMDGTGALRTLHSFAYTDGANPYAPLIQARDGSFYGTTMQGGASGYGTIFKLDAAGVLTTLHSFNSNDGANPRAGLIQASDGSLYGTTYGGGPNGVGVVFRLTINDPPAAAGDSYSTAADTALTVAVPGVLANDTDAEGNVLSARLVTAPSHGRLTLSANGAFTYTPAAAYKGPDSFTYKANDGTADSNVATVSITVTPATATLTYPVNTAKNVDMSQPITWTAVPGASAYYLYVGTSLGAKDVVNSGEIQTTSYRAVNVPASVTLYARLWTKVAGVWRFVDSTFTAAPLAYFITPTNGATDVNLTQPIHWTTVANAEAYYLYVGSSPGGKDLVNTGELQGTSYPASRLPGGQLLYARLWTKAGGVWRYTDITFTEAPIAYFITPASGATNVSLAQAIQWTTVSNAQAYNLYVGSSVGAKDMLDTGELQTTSYLATRLPTAQLLYARLWTKVADQWRSTDISFTAAPMAYFITPINGATDVSLAQPMQWTTVAGAEAYYLYVGSSLGAKDLVNTGELQVTSYLASRLPAGQLLYARLWTKVGGHWRYTDIMFTAR
jgi:uncharacterized repeat protein (TIGR03803 family)/VCBS repeat-containing protein